jgi:hypothetical protein
MIQILWDPNKMLNGGGRSDMWNVSGKNFLCEKLNAIRCNHLSLEVNALTLCYAITIHICN